MIHFSMGVQTFAHLFDYNEIIKQTKEAIEKERL